MIVQFPDVPAVMKTGLCYCCQVIIVGDLNVAASQKDVHSKLKYDRMYSPEEKALFHSLLNDYTDAWRLQHPEEQSTFTVWDEKTSARAFNEVRSEQCITWTQSRS